MTPFLPWPILGGSLFAAVAMGVHLGESAVDLINPIHFQGPAVHPRDRGVALDPNRIAPRAPPVFASLYGWDEARVALIADCGDCRAWRARSAHVRPAAYGWPAAEARVHRGGDDELVRLVAEAEAQVRAPESAEPAGDDVVQRYVEFPVTQPPEPRVDDDKDLSPGPGA